VPSTQKIHQRQIEDLAAGLQARLKRRLQGLKTRDCIGKVRIFQRRQQRFGRQVLIVKPALPARTVPELIALARQKPGELNYASIGIGSAPHLGAELFKAVANVDITHVPYRGSSAQAISALLAGDVAMFLVGTSTAVPHIQSGALRGLAVTASKRVDGLPDVPTFAEAGLPGVDVSIWFAVLVPGGTPPAIIKKLNADIVQVVADLPDIASLQTPLLTGSDCGCDLSARQDVSGAEFDFGSQRGIVRKTY
jgi:hypothetical protein